MKRQTRRNASRRTPSSTEPRARQRPAGAVAFDALERRRLFDAVFPSAAEEYELTILNRARANPTAEVARWSNDPNFPWPGADLNEGITTAPISSTPKQPLALNPYLIDAARKHSVWDGTVNGGVLNHDEGTVGPDQRMVAAGYKFGPSFTWGENMATNPGDPASQGAMDGDQELMIIDSGIADRGHRRAIMNDGVNEVGLGVGAVTGGGQVLTEDFANSGNGSFLTGVLFNDTNFNSTYDIGEGLGGVTITATNAATNQSFTTTSWDSGGYTLALAPGTYTVTATGGAIGAPTARAVTITTQNVEADFTATASATPALPTVTTQPQDALVNTGDTATYAVAGTGSPFPTVQWQVSTDAGATYTNITGATGFTYSVAASAGNQSALYRAVLTNSQGSTNSNAAKLSVLGVPVNITQEVQGQSANVGDPVTFTVAATGSVTYQWFTGNDFSTLAPVAGATGTSYTFTAQASPNPLFVQVQVSNGGTSSYSTNVLSVNTGPVTPSIVAQPLAATATAGGNATLTVAVAGTPAPTVQWQVATPAAAPAARRRGIAPAFRAFAATTTTFVDAAGLTEATVTLPVTMADNHAVYRAVITNGEGSVTTAPIKLTVNKRSATANDRTSLATAVAAAKAAIAACHASTTAAAKVLTADLKRLKASADVRQKLAAYVAQEKAGRALFTRDETAYLGNLTRLAATADAAATKLARDPTNATQQAALQSAVTALTAATNGTTAIPADATHCSLGQIDKLVDLSAVAPSDAQLNLDLYAAGLSANGVGHALQAPVTIAQAVAARLTTDAQA